RTSANKSSGAPSYSRWSSSQPHQDQTVNFFCKEASWHLDRNCVDSVDHFV
ncbi:RNA binding motif single stranded interacting protein 3, partial [Homo sapiens]